MIDYMPLLKAIESALEKAGNDLTAFLASAGYKNPAELSEAVEAVQDKLEDILSAYADRIEYALEEKENPLDLLTGWNKIKEDEALKQSASDTVAEALLSYLMPHLDEYIKDDDPDLSATDVSEKTVGRIFELADLVAEGKIDSMNRYVTTAIEALFDTEKAVRKSDDEDDETSDEEEPTGDSGSTDGKSVIATILASTILERIMDCRSTATTAVVSYQSIVQQEAISQNPAVLTKKWNHCKDPGVNPRPYHLALDGVIADADGFFTLIGEDGNVYNVEYPRESSLPVGEVANCHCTVTSVVDEEMLALDSETKLQLQANAIAVMDEQFEKDADPSLIDRAKRWIKAYIAVGIAEELIDE